MIDRHTHRMSDARPNNDRILLGHRELELVGFADLVLHGCLHEKLSKTQIQQRDRNVERPNCSSDASQNFDARITPSFGGRGHSRSSEILRARGSAAHLSKSAYFQRVGRSEHETAQLAAEYAVSRHTRSLS